MANYKPLDLIKSIRNEPKSAQSLAEEHELSINYVRNICDELERGNVIRKRRRGRQVLYHVIPPFNRDEPLMPIQGIDKNYNYVNPLIFATVDISITKSFKAMEFFPKVCTMIIMAGARYNALIADVDSESDKFRKQKRTLNVELKALKAELITHIDKYKIILNYLETIKETEDFWELDELRKYFTAQLDEAGQLIPNNIDLALILERYNEYKQETPEQ